jgi:nucleoside-diphosphate-sugar epimerase
MMVFCTGATGFVGAHTALALLAAGHELRLLVRDQRAASNWFQARGHHIDDFVTVDIRDQAGLESSMAGCDGVFHAAGSVLAGPRKAREMYAVNVGGTQAVLGAAKHLDIRNLLYVSSVAVFFNPDAARVDETSPLADMTEPYSRSKRDSEEAVRELQRRGTPIQITYPSGVIGPDDPGLSAANRGFAACVGKALPRSTTGFQCIDVRDLADAHVWLLEHPPAGDIEDARYIVGGHFYPWDELRQRIEAVLSRRIFSPHVSPRLMRAMGAVADGAKKVVPFDMQISAESMAITTQWPPADSSRLIMKSGLSFRVLEETIGETIRWMAEAGYIPHKKAGRLVCPPAPAIERHGAS